MESVDLQTFNGHQIACAFTDAGGKDIVIICHGFRGCSLGPSRAFVRLSRKLAESGISSLRFDQYGCGNSEGDFLDSSFNDWVNTTKAIAEHFLQKGYRVSLLGQSMGGPTVLIVGSDLQDIKAVVAWVPAAQVGIFTPSANGIFEEGGQIVQNTFWQESFNANIIDKLKTLKSPAYIVQCSNDEHITKEDHKAIATNAQPNHTAEMYEGYTHSSWKYDETNDIIDKSIAFIRRALA